MFEQIIHMHDLSRLITIFAALLLCGCNNDIFVEDFAPDVRQLTLDGAGDTGSLTFKSGHWDILGIGDNYGDHLQNVEVIPDGGTAGNGKELEGDGRISVNNTMLGLTVERRGAAVTVNVKYALGNEDFTLSLWARDSKNDISQVIEITINPVSDGFELIDIVYDSNLDMWTQYGDPYWRDILTVSNNGDTPIEWRWIVGGIVSFYELETSWEYDELRPLLGGISIPVPEWHTDVNYGCWVVDEAVTVPITVVGRGVARLTRVPEPPVSTLQPKSVNTLRLMMEYVGFTFNMHVRNTITGTEHELWGILKMEHPAWLDRCYRVESAAME